MTTLIKSATKKKWQTEEEAISMALPIISSNSQIGKLIPVGPWILNNPEKIDQICSWRTKNMGMFLTQIENNHQLTRKYLENYPIKSTDRILFLIIDEDDKFVGHMGLADITETGCELDNVMKGKFCTPENIMQYAQEALINWAFSHTEISNCRVGVLSENKRAIALYEKGGFSEKTEHYLHKETTDGCIKHRVTDYPDRNVDYTYTILNLRKQK